MSFEIGEREALTDKIDKKAEQLLNATDEVREKWVNRLLNSCKYDHEKYVIVMGYLYGLRPIELMKMTKSDFRVIPEQDNLITRLPTAKQRRRKSVIPGNQRPAKKRPRLIALSISQTPFVPFLATYVIECANLLPLGWTSASNINQVFKRVCEAAGTGRVSYYVFRKMRLDYIDQNLNPSIADLLAWKGGTDIRSLKSYLLSRPITKWRTSIK